MLVLCACSYAWWLFIISSCHLVILKWLYLPVSMGNPDWSRRSVRDQSDASSWRGFAFRRALGSRTYRRCLYLYHSTSFYIILIHSTCISIFYICILYLYSKFYIYNIKCLRSIGKSRPQSSSLVVVPEHWSTSCCFLSSVTRSSFARQRKPRTARRPQAVMESWTSRIDCFIGKNMRQW